jgi:hypothetical protein
MKFTKMSLVAALLVGSSAFAIDNVKVSGDAKLYYATDDKGTVDLFNKDNAAGQAALSVGITADLTEGVSFGGKVTGLSTLGLQGQLVNNVWEATNGVTDSYIVNDLWIAATMGKTTAKIGRMELDTPLVFTEKWSIVENTFEAAVLINQDIPDTTLVGAYVGGSNGSINGNTTVGGGYAGVVDKLVNDTTFDQFYNGAYTAGVINNSWKPLTVQAWYYSATKILTTYWLQADLNIEGILAGAQYTALDFNHVSNTNNAYSLMLGYEMKDMFTAKVSYSATDKKGGAGRNLSGTATKSKLYTEAWWNYGYITQADTESYTVSLESPVNGMVDLGLYYTDADQSAAANDNDMKEFTLTAGKDLGPLNATLAYIYTDANDQNNGDDYNTIQAYLTYNF